MIATHRDPVWPTSDARRLLARRSTIHFSTSAVSHTFPADSSTIGFGNVGEHTMPEKIRAADMPPVDD
ncbi:hypothetical protein [Frankia sp. CIT1]|uniref:hypothetical protein n=1 Tax=Frankia sp. CIT1 TaxID=2880974 RepID=UPI001EF506C9|nr:hypothetical protein [Frankia sp. CIT1]